MKFVAHLFRFGLTCKSAPGSMLLLCRWRCHLLAHETSISRRHSLHGVCAPLSTKRCRSALCFQECPVLCSERRMTEHWISALCYQQPVCLCAPPIGVRLKKQQVGSALCMQVLEESWTASVCVCLAIHFQFA